MFNKQSMINHLTNAQGGEPLYPTKAEAERAINNVLDTIKALVKQCETGERLNISRFGSFKKVARVARRSQHPSTGETLQIPASTSLTFKVSSPFKKSLTDRS